jgi:ElaB/YqjD/DUF883 family membrane-anchored ribosome-binding protein
MRTLSRAPGLAPALAIALALLAVSGCASAYYGAMEQIGIEKRDILVDRVDDARDAQADARDRFVSALEAFRSVVEVDGGELEATYDRLSRAHESSQEAADRVRDRVEEVRTVSRDLFREWRAELGQYSDPGLRRESERTLARTEARYEALAQRMDAAVASMEPVLRVLNDRVLFLKHNLNARAIASLGGERARLEADVAALVRDMERAIAEADAFIAEMRSAA